MRSTLPPTSNDFEDKLASLQATLEATEDCIIAVDAAGKIVNFNQKIIVFGIFPRR